jgi:hypothetical protein
MLAHIAKVQISFSILVSVAGRLSITFVYLQSNSSTPWLFHYVHICTVGNENNLMCCVKLKCISEINICAFALNLPVYLHITEDTS